MRKFEFILVCLLKIFVFLFAVTAIGGAAYYAIFITNYLLAQVATAVVGSIIMIGVVSFLIKHLFLGREIPTADKKHY